METRVFVYELTPASVSRSRGKQAFHKLQSYLMAGPVQIDFDARDLVSISFIDELVLRLMESQQLDKVVFLSSSEALREKLAQVAALRKATIYFRSRPGEANQVIAPKSVPAIILEELKREAR